MSIYNDNGELDARKVAAAIAANCIDNSQIYYAAERAENILDDVEGAICELRDRGELYYYEHGMDDDKLIGEIVGIVKCFRRDRFFELVQGAYEEAGFGECAAIELAESDSDYIEECVDDGSTDDDVLRGLDGCPEDVFEARVEEVRAILIAAYDDAGVPGWYSRHEAVSAEGDNEAIAYYIKHDYSDDRIADDLAGYASEWAAEWWTNSICDLERRPEYDTIKQACEEHEAQIPDEYVDQDTDDIDCGGTSGMTWTTRAVITGWIKAGMPQAWIDTLQAINDNSND